MTDQTIRLDAACEIQAAAGDKPPRVSILAYGGGPMKPPGWPTLVIDLAGLEMGANVVLLAEHNESLSGVIGAGTPTVRDQKLWVEGTLAETEPAAKIVALAKAGVPLSASVGVEPLEKERINGGGGIVANGGAFNAPKDGAVLIKRGRLREVSVVVNGADSSAFTNIAAKGQAMSFDAETEVQAAVRAERERFTKIDALTAGNFGDQAEHVATLRARAVAGEITLEDLASEVVKAMRDARAPQPHVFRPSAVRNGASNAMSSEVLEASFIIKAGHTEAAGRIFRPEVVDAASRIRHRSTVEILRDFLTASNVHLGDGSADQVIRAGFGFSQLSLPNALADSLGKLLLDTYSSQNSDWKLYTRKMSAADFKTQTAVRPILGGALQQVGATGEIKHATLGEDAYTWSLGTYARMLSITRTDIINDDLKLFNELPQILADAARRSFMDKLITVLLAGIAANHWASGNSNKLSGGSAGVLNIANLTAAIKLLRRQLDSDGKSIDLVPSVLLVPPELEMTALALVNSTEVLGSSGPSGNPLRNTLKVVVEPRLSNSNFSGYDVDAWFVFAQPSAGALLAGFLNGRETPVVETEQADFNVLGIQTRVYFDFGAALGDYRASVYADGT